MSEQLAGNMTSKQIYALQQTHWTRLSERYAESASGTVTAFTFGGHPVGTGVFWNTELPAVIRNRKITGMVMK